MLKSAIKQAVTDRQMLNEAILGALEYRASEPDPKIRLGLLDWIEKWRRQLARLDELDRRALGSIYTALKSDNPN
jgi:hypothetical protein